MVEPLWRNKYGNTPEEQEKQDAKEMGGRRNPGSGNRWFAPMDSQSPDFITDNKRTSAQSYTLKAKTFIEVLNVARKAGKNGRMSILFDGTKDPVTGEDLHLTIMLDSDFKRTIDLLK